jgi:rubrerythrin
VKLRRIKGNEAIDSDDCISVVDEEEAALDQELGDDPTKVAAHLGLLSSDVTILSAAEAKEVQDSLDLAQLTDAFTKLAKARRLEEKAISKIRDVLARQPSLSALASALAPVKLQSEFLPSPAEQMLVQPSTSRVIKPGNLSTPVKTGDRWKCRYCPFSSSMYETMEGHTRKLHTREKVDSQCPVCGRGDFLHKGSFCTHIAQCKGKGRRAGDEGEPTPKRVKTELIE